MGHGWPRHFEPHVVGRSLGSSALSSYSIALEAWRRGLDVAFRSHDLRFYTIGDGTRSVDFDYSRPNAHLAMSSHTILNDKSATATLLREEGVAVPKSILLDATSTSLESLREVANQLGFPLVLKPNSGSFGRDVLTGLSDWDELRSGYEYLRNRNGASQILLERHVQGDDYRILVVGQRVVGAVKRIPAQVVGDGISAIEELIRTKNEIRRLNPFLSAGLIRMDFEMEKCLRMQELRLSDVPEDGAVVTLRRVANASAGGDTVDVTDSLPQAIFSAAVQAVRAVPHVYIAGVDVLYEPGSQVSTEGYSVLEMNPRPHIGVNMYPSSGEGRDVPLAMIDELFPGSRRNDSSLLRTTRFNEGAVGSMIRSGLASRVPLRPLPAHHYPVRRHVKLVRRSIRVGGKLPSARALQQAAHTSGVSGSIRRTSSDDFVLRVAAKAPEQANSFVRKIARLLDARTSSEADWHGPVSTMFSVHFEV